MRAAHASRVGARRISIFDERRVRPHDPQVCRAAAHALCKHSVQRVHQRDIRRLCDRRRMRLESSEQLVRRAFCARPGASRATNAFVTVGWSHARGRQGMCPDFAGLPYGEDK